ncbi:dipeptidyl peptidase 2-like [Asterias rubens]|uniref:dipeptidyl peptidase 2-like n=1 Tax=Asterias rubens TaxID=7604 RepID=UPI0014555C9D|nr:dipeptidyl peptidase 2-like [Asterias rubens]
MFRLFAVSLLAFLLISLLSSCTAVYPYKTQYFDQMIDHFNFASHGNNTFKQRYLVSDQHWSIGKGPIFFYTGNEGPITSFLENTGLMFDIAPEFRALLVFAEHRFYGETLPFGNDSFIPENLGLLTIEQALADYAELILFLKQELKCPECKVVTFGGSYGGMLSAYMRFKYPNTVDGAIASSAPIYSVAGQGSQSYFFEDVTKSFGSGTTGKACVSTIRQAFITLNELADQGIKGLNEISSAFKLCKPLQDKTQIAHLQGWVRNAFTSMAMVNYPYPASFLGQLPAWPVSASCDLITSAKDPLKGLAAGAGLFYNGTKGSLKCMDVDSQYVECTDPTGCGLGNSAKAWDWQGCTEVTLPGGTNNVTDMFPVLPFTLEMRETYCKAKWNVVPKPTWLNVIMWGEDIKSASNIVFCNGALDPWRDGGVLRSPKPGSLDAYLIADGAHHLDLRGANPADPESVKLARQFEKDQITAWIK